MRSKQHYFQKLKLARPQNLSQMSTRNFRRPCQKLKHGQPFLHPHQEIVKKTKKCNSRIWNCTWKFRLVSLKVEKILKGILDSIPSPSPSVQIQIRGGKVCLRRKGKTLLDISWMSSIYILGYFHLFQRFLRLQQAEIFV